MTDNKVSAKSQYFASISANLLLLAFGCGIGWLSMALPLLQSDESPLITGPLTVEDISWIGSALSLGALMGNISIGYIVNIIGSRHSILLIGFPQLVGWLFMTFGTCPMHLAISRFLTGYVVGGAQVCTSLYTAEIADNDIRGQLGTIYQYARNLGILLAYSLGSYYSYIISSIFFSGITILFFGTFVFFPSTPQYLLQRRQSKAAENSFKFYNKHTFETEPKLYSIQFESLKMAAKEVKNESKLTLRDIADARFAIVQSIVFGLLNLLSAQFVFLTYSTAIVAKSGTHLSSGVSSVCMALVQTFATFVAYILIDKKGRKFLMISSMIGCTLGHAVMVAYLHLHTHGVDTTMFHWTPIICMSWIIFSASIGVVPLTLICMAESFPTKTRPFGLTLGTVVMNLLGFLIIKAFPILVVNIGLEACIVIFCISCALGSFYTIFFVEETQGKDLNTVDEMKMPRNESFVSK